MGEAAMMLERWNGIYRQLKAISEDSSIEPEHRMHALAAMSENVKSRVGFFRDSPAMLALQHRRLLEASLGHTASITQPSLNSYSPTPFPPLYGGRQQQQQEQEEQGEEEGDYNRDHEF